MKFYDVVPGLDFMEEYDLEQSPAWFLDATHSVPPWTPMFGWFWINFCRHGMQYGAETLSLPTVKGWDWRFKDGGGYLTLLMVTTDQEKAEREKKFREAIRPFVENYDGLWGGYVKEILKRYENLKTLDVSTASNIKLLENFEETIDTCRRMWEIHMHMMYGTYTPYVLFEQLCTQLLQIDDTHPTFHKLVAGFDNESFRVDRRLWELSKKAKDMGLEGLFKETPSKQMAAKLGGSDKGKTYLKEFNNFLDKEAGWRMERMAEINVPTWQEDPTPGFETVKMYLKKGGEFDLDQDRKKIEKERKDAEKEVLGKIPSDKKGWFSMLMKVAQNCSRFSEEHNHYLDLYTHALMRRSCMGLGNRFAKSGAINQPDDIFFLMPDEVRKAGINPDKLNLKPIVQRRRKEWEEWNQKGNPPAIFKEGFTLEQAIGGLVQSLDPIALKVVVGSMPVPKPELKADLLGTCGSSGMAEGIARVVMRDEDLPTIQKGDILVAMSTSPAWTPVFSMISGVVVDRGASLSHAAIVGREYGIPVVMNVFTGTQVIKSGQRIRVDGNLGAVYILDK
ncbi:MAG TPA: PEP-utilizing enzyme [Thermodesulfobacteriota bacterium]|jgi:phosphohistidine swiveling domain-containing protein|nr:PEP-utilizing enzyme [Thermodesulfobacteriota bacterium]